MASKKGRRQVCSTGELLPLVPGWLRPDGTFPLYTTKTIYTALSEILSQALTLLVHFKLQNLNLKTFEQ